MSLSKCGSLNVGGKPEGIGVLGFRVWCVKGKEGERKKNVHERAEERVPFIVGEKWREIMWGRVVVFLYVLASKGSFWILRKYQLFFFFNEKIQK